MLSSSTNSGVATLPDGYIAIAISDNQKPATLKISVLVRLEPDPVGGHLVVLHDTTDAKVLLGCIIDQAERVHEWIELWIQNTEALINTASAARQSLSNAMLDDRWHRQCRAFEHLDEAALIKTGWETENPLPTFLDLAARCPVHPVDADSKSPWKLCVDEALLAQKELPGYATSLHRYLYLPASGAQSPLVPLTPQAPANASTKQLSEILGDSAHLVPFNPAAGLMLVKKHAPIPLETFIDILSGAAWDGLKHGRAVLDLGGQVNGLRKDQTTWTAEGRLLLEAQGRCGRLVETFYLKLRLLADIVSSVHAMVRHLQRPLLNIGPDHWQVRLGEPGHGLPFLWTAKPVLTDAGDAIPLAIEKSDLKYYLPALGSGTSVYRPLVTSLPAKGRASTRIRRVLTDPGGATIVEGTFTTHERLDAGSHDLVWFRLNLAGAGANLYAHIEADSAMAAAEWRFRTVAQTFNDAEVSALHAAEGVPMAEIPFEIIPLLSTPCDLYSLAVMALRVLLVDKTNSLPVVLDETLSLARQLAADYDDSYQLHERISNTFNQDPRWLESLGPHHLIFDELPSEQALGLIPPELWWKTLAVIVRMFPGLGPDSQCKDYGHAQQGGLHKVFEQAIADLDLLILMARGLIFADWESNAEVSDVIQRYLV
ncbi:MAG TPA: hypothetical protein VMX13_13295 [Sedimentisphaerales bacterium]|nr:hypothetical protein [Sedimentisphaerales bacterium]